MSFIYPRTIKITRSAVPIELGASTYSGETAEQEQCIAEGLPASIQFKSMSGKPDANLPADASRKTYWLILIPLQAMPVNLVRTRDIITDDGGERYAVTSNYWNSFGGNYIAEKLEV